jgi:hypothetical protein
MAEPTPPLRPGARSGCSSQARAIGGRVLKSADSLSTTPRPPWLRIYLPTEARRVAAPGVPTRSGSGFRSPSCLSSSHQRRCLAALLSDLSETAALFSQYASAETFASYLRADEDSAALGSTSAKATIIRAKLGLETNVGRGSVVC